MSDLVWSCTLDKPAELSVGAKFHVACSGESFDLQPNSFRFLGRAEKHNDKQVDKSAAPSAPNPAGGAASETESPGNPYYLKILKVESADSHQLSAEVTSYVPGRYRDGAIVLTDGRSVIQLKGLEFEVGSVIRQGQQAEPYPAYPPWVMSFPWWFWLSLAALVFTPSFFLWKAAKKQKARRKLIEELERHKTARPPFDEFHREIRQLEKRYGVEPQDTRGYCEELEKTFRMYLVRELVIPALDWSDGDIFREIKKKHSLVYRDCNVGIRKVFRELERAAKATPTIKDCQQLVQMAREVSEAIFKVQNNKAKERGI